MNKLTWAEILVAKRVGLMSSFAKYNSATSLICYNKRMKSSRFYSLIFALMIVLCFVLSGTSAQSETIYAPAQKKAPRKIKNRKPQNSNGFEVTPLDPDLSYKSFEDAGYRLNKNTLPKNSMSDPRFRDKTIQKYDLERHIQGWDQLDRDMLWMRAENYDLEKYKAIYSKLPEQNITSFYFYVQKLKAGQVRRQRDGEQD